MLQREFPLNRLFLFILATFLFLGAFLEFQKIAWGTGAWVGQFAPKWAFALLAFGVFCILCLAGVWIKLWAPHRLEKISRFLSAARQRLGPAHWLLAALLLAFPVYFLQYTFWGIVLHGPFLRVVLAGISSILLGWTLTTDRNTFLTWGVLLAALVVTAGMYTLFVPLIEVTSYPFSLGWSEGNRLWDYSVLFARDIYVYPADQPIPVLLDMGRRIVGGIPFLIPGVKIWQVRLWGALVDVVPYLVLGWVTYRLDKTNLVKWLLAGVWVFMFVRQGPIHPPLLISAIIVALAWGRPLWLAIPLIALASYFAEISRFTWMFAPGMWAGMLVLSGVVTRDRQLDKKTWVNAIALGIAGLVGGYVIPFWGHLLVPPRPTAVTPAPSHIAGAEEVVSPVVAVAAAESSAYDQPLIWGRLFPNATYGEGILIGLALAVLPLIFVLLYLVRTGRWKLNLWQKLAIVLPLFAFLVVGLIVSVKIGGGGDLHNMDMFIIGLMFAGAIAWRNGGSNWIDELPASSAWVQFMMVALIVIPGYKALMQLSPISTKEDLMTVATLADIVEDPLPNPLPDTLPSEADAEKALERIQTSVAEASQNGDVLFMDQRQLLTFGYIQDVPLVPEYDKKMLINEAMSGNAQYFAGFYQDLAAQRFSLIITNPVNRRLNRTEGHFSEENNAWVKWVTTPLLCYYESMDRLKRVDVELLVPRQDVSGCEQVLPIHATE